MKYIITAIALSVSATGAFAQTKGGDAGISATGTCPTNAMILSDYPSTVLGCSCPSNGSAGSVWGSGPYTSDSDLCTAARHKGIVGAEGGLIWVRIGSGQDRYDASTSNGVGTLSYGQYPSSFDFVSSLTMAAAPMEQCPENMMDQPATLTCECSEDKTTAGTVWGTDIYTNDSGICRAAVHAGRILENGGVVTVVPTTNNGTYTGSTRHGVTSSNYDSWPGAFMFQ